MHPAALLLAAAPPDAANWMDNLQWLVTFALAVALLWSKVFPGTQKREVSFSGTPTDRKDFDAHLDVNRREHEGLHTKIGGSERGLRTEFTRLAEKVAAVGNDVSALQATTSLQNQALAQIDTKVTKLLSETRKHHEP